MARSDKVPFRREFTVTEDGYLGGSNGMIVGDILSLHIDVVATSLSLLVEGRVGIEGDWTSLINIPNAEQIKSIDIKAYEFVRVRTLNVEETTNVIMFGYSSPVVSEEITVKLAKAESDRDIVNMHTLKCILKALNKIETQLSFLTEEEL